MNSAQSANPIVHARGLALQFDEGRTKALDGVDIQIGEGEMLALVGPSGCGKSSLLNLLGTLDEPTAGEIWFRSKPYSRLGDLSLFRGAHIGFVFQSFNLIPTLCALDNVLVPTVARKGSARAKRQRAVELLDGLGLGDKLERYPGKLSGGERQRVAIARALINGPDLILADEPTGSLDSANGEQVLSLFAMLQRERGLTMVLATHDPAISARADRIVALRDGRVVDTEGSPA